MISLRIATATLASLRRNGFYRRQTEARASRPRLAPVSRLAALVFSVGLAALSAQTAQGQTTVTLPFDTDFEADEGYSVGPLTSDALWQFGPGLDAAIITPGAGSSQAMQFSGSDWLWLLTDSQAAQVSWVDFYTKPVFVEASDLPEIIQTEQSAVTGFVKVDAEGEVFAIDGDGLGGGTWTPSAFRTALDADGESAFDWIRLTYRIDYFAKSWDLFIDGQLSLVDLGFLDDTRTALDEFAVLADAETPTLLDYFYAGNGNPLFIDTSKDGLPDDWLLAHGLDPNLYQRYADADLDGLSNLAEYRLGTSPTLADTSGDGLDDGLKVLLDLAPLAIASGPFGQVPFADGFEGDAPGPFASGTRLWSLADGSAAVSAEPDAPEGLHYLAATGDDPVTLTRIFEDPAAHDAVWIDLRLKVGYHSGSEPPEITAPRAASAFYFGDDGRLRALDGNGQGGGQWLALDHPPVEEGAWARLSVYHDYAAQTWSVWIDDVRHAQHLGFRDTVPAFSHLQFDDLNALDDVSVAATEPAALDNDGDGLANAEELALGTDPDAFDTSGDGMDDGDKLRYGLDPLTADTFVATLQADGQGGYFWQTEFSSTEGFVPGPLHDQNGWTAASAELTSGETASFTDSVDAASMERFFGSHKLSALWLDFRARLTPGELPEIVSDGGLPLSLVFGFSAEQRLSVYDASAGAWTDFTTEASASEWNDYAVHLDYVSGRAMLLVNGQLVAADLLFFNDDGTTLTRLRILQDALEEALDEPGPATEIDRITIATAEPADLDFSGDGMTNAEKRALGLDPWLNDNSGDGFPDVWLVQYGLDPNQNHDPNADLDGDGLSLQREHDLGIDPTRSDTDGDGYSDWEELRLLVTDPADSGDEGDYLPLVDFHLSGIDPGLPGIAFKSAEPDPTYYFTASGDGIVQGRDSGHLIHREIEGDFTVVAKAERFESDASDSEIGLMARTSLDGNSWSASFVRKSNKRYYRLYQQNADSGAFQVGKLNFRTQAEGWLKLVRSGSDLYAYASRDGVAWTLVGTAALPDSNTFEVGVFAASGNKFARGFANISILQWDTDADRDGILDADEALHGTSPTESDTDGDGYSDYEEINEFFSDPTTADLSPAEEADGASGAAFSASTGEWGVDGSGAHAQTGRGAVAYEISVPDDAIYRLNLFGGTAFNEVGIEEYSIDVEIDGVFIGRTSLSTADSGRARILTPWLAAGTHEVRFFIDNTYTDRSLRVGSVSAEYVDGPDIDQSGVPDWMENRLTTLNGVENAAPGTVAESVVSPFSLEGRARYLEFLSVDSGSATPLPAPEDRFHLDIPLDPNQETAVDLAFENNGLGETVSIAWVPFGIAASNDDLILRKGESLRFVLDTADTLAGNVTYEVDGVAIGEASPGVPLEHLFDEPGDYDLSATAETASGTIQHSVLVEVRDAELGEPVYVLDANPISWSPPLFGEELASESDSRISVEALSGSSGGRTFRLGGVFYRPRYLAARTDYESDTSFGRILDTVAVHSLRMASNEAVHIQEEYVFADGTQLISAGIVFSEVPEDLQVDISIFVSGVTFTDGSLKKTLTAADFDETGRATFEFLKSPQVENSVCHRLKVYLGDTFIGSN